MASVPPSPPLGCNATRAFSASRAAPTLRLQPPTRIPCKKSSATSPTPSLHSASSTAPPFRHFCAEAERLWLFNNAGTVVPSAPLGTQDDEQIALTVNLNITAPLLLSNAVVAEARRPDNVNIVHIGSGAGRKAYPGWSIYGASKAALDRHAASAANEERGVRIVSLAPGTVDTAMQEGMRRDPHFPLREHFAKIHADGGLQNANDTALKILAYCLSEQFGREAIVDIRSIELPL